VAVAEAARREADEVFGVSSERLLVIPTAVDPARLEERGGEAIRAELGIPGDAPVVLSIGALDPEKDPLAHLDVGRRVLASIPEARHVVAGDGPLRKPVARAARDPRILLVGERRDVGRLLAAADVLVVASRSEGLPASVLEAGVTGVPVAAFAVGGVPEVVEDGVTGLLVGAGDRAALAAAAVRLLRDRSLGRRVAAAARERSRGFHIGEVTGPYLELFAAMGRAKAGR